MLSTKTLPYSIAFVSKLYYNKKEVKPVSDNICKFVQSKNIPEKNINIINFVYEKDANFKQSFIYSACYCMYLVTDGTGILHTAKNDYPISTGNLFFTFSSKPFYIQNTGDLRYIYISFIGLRISPLFERLNISYASPVYENFLFLRERWTNDFDRANNFNIDLICEGLLLHTLSFFSQRNDEKAERKESNGMLALKTYVDMHYSEASLNMKSVSQKFNYSYKYVSNAFKRLTRVSFSVYLSNLRLNHAQELLKSGISNLQEVADSSGFSDTQYFSKAFKKKFNITPMKYCKELKENH